MNSNIKAKYLIDTHIFIWAIMEPEKLSKKASAILENEGNKIYLSSMTFWEIAIKCQSKKLDLGRINILHLPNIVSQFDFEILNPDPYDFLSIGQVPLKENHRDPFDRMLIQQAIRNNLILISKDEKFPQYEENGLQLLW